MSCLPRNYLMTSGPTSPAEATAMAARGRTMWRWALALVIAGAFLAAFGSDIVSRAHATPGEIVVAGVDTKATP